MPRIVPGVSPAEAAAELLRRDEARKDPAKFTEFVFPFKPARHHRLILSVLSEALTGGQDRVLLCAPPGHGKSHYTSIVFPTYCLGVRKDFRVIAATHTSDLANKWSRRVRAAVGGEQFKRLFDFGLNPNSQAVERWETAAGGEYFAATVGSAIQGNRANGCIIDDPFPDEEAAQSKVYQEKVAEWYYEDILPRLLPGAFVILMHQRLHENDLAGQIEQMERAGGDKWRKLILPAEAEANDPLGRKPGEPLWPELFDEKVLARLKANLHVRSWSAKYQQKPIPESGDFFQREWIRYYDKAPDNLRIYMAADYAVTSDGGDYTVFIVGGVDEGGDLYILDLWRGQKSTDVWIEHAMRLIRAWEPLVWVEESGPIWRAVDPFITRRVLETRNYQARHQLASIADKASRARAIQGRMSMGKVLFPKNAPWLADFEIELLSFDAGKYDDQVDAFALLGRMLHTMSPAKARPMTREQKLEDLRAKLAVPERPTFDQLWKDRDRQRRAVVHVR